MRFYYLLFTILLSFNLTHSKVNCSSVAWMDGTRFSLESDFYSGKELSIWLGNEYKENKIYCILWFGLDELVIIETNKTTSESFLTKKSLDGGMLSGKSINYPENVKWTIIPNLK